jgi:hypothetical protein
MLGALPILKRRNKKWIEKKSARVTRRWDSKLLWLAFSAVPLIAPLIAYSEKKAVGRCSTLRGVVK